MQNSKDECLLQEVLYDSVLMVDYSFLKPQKGIHLPDERLKNLAITWLLVADNAIWFVRYKKLWFCCHVGDDF